MTILREYTSRLLELWIARIFLALDLLGLITFIIAYFKPDFAIPRWVYWLFFAFVVTTFFGANVKLFADIEAEKQRLWDRICELEATQANIHLEPEKVGFYPSHGGISSPFPEIKVDQYGFNEHGLPGWATIWVDLVVRNTGYEEGELVWELDRTKTCLPPLFTLDKGHSGEFFKGPLSWIEPRQKPFLVKWILRVRIVEQDPYSFAKAIGSLDTYSVVINYRTKRIDGESPTHEVVIDGDFQEFRQKVIDHWKWRHEDLAQLAESQ